MDNISSNIIFYTGCPDKNFIHPLKPLQTKPYEIYGPVGLVKPMRIHAIFVWKWEYIL